jgi:mono/diheme cytochrome c family protein
VTRNEIILGLATLVLIGFSLVVAIVVPRRNPDFPGARLGLFSFVAVLLVAGMLATVEIFGAEERAEGAGAEQAPAEEAPPEEQAGGGAPEGGAAGEEIFAASGCGSCHALEAAGSSGTIGPNLDERKPTLEAAVEQITNGGNGMPAFGDRLSPEEIRAVASFVVESSQG